jgi:hypothetical protein
MPTRFFCEECGSEIPAYAERCAVCGKHFAGVRCPKCNRIGTHDQFVKGCPFCGYGVIIDAIPRPKRPPRSEPPPKSPLSGLIYFLSVVVALGLLSILLLL